MAFERITVDAGQMGGVPCVRGLRFPVATVVAMVADGMSTAEILAEHPDLEAEDIAECLRYVVAALDANAQRAGSTQAEYLRRVLADHQGPPVTRPQLDRFTERTADLGDRKVMAAAWR